MDRKILKMKVTQLMKNGRTYVKSIKEYHELAAYADEVGFEIKDGEYEQGTMKTKILVRLKASA